MFKLMTYVAVYTAPGVQQRLLTKELINQHVDDPKTLMKLEFMMGDYNFDFLQGGRTLSFLDGFAQNIQQWISSTLMDSLARLSPQNKPHSTN